MLCPDYYCVRLSDFDLLVFRAFVPVGHRLRDALAVIPWNEFYEKLAPYYSPNEGQPAINPVLMLKLEYLRYQYNLSDGEVTQRGQTDIAFRFFLQIPERFRLPHPSSLSYFRGRLGSAGFRDVFDQLVAIARERGLVKDRLRIKDASHVLANIAVPSTLALVAQARDKLLAAAEPFDALRVEGERINIELLRERTNPQKPEEKLVTRVTHLREILAWTDELTPPEDADASRAWQTFVQRRALAHKILADQQNPDAQDRTRSTVDPDARRAKHGQWYDGYLLDMMMDADSELITGMNVLPGNGDEAAGAVELICQEEAAHGNHVEALSMDGVGFNGPMLRDVEDPEGLAVNVFVPPPKEQETGLFTPEDFVEDQDRGTVTCPAGQTSSSRERNEKDRGWIYRFKPTTCAGCPLVSHCMKHPPQGRVGRKVRKTEYEAERRRAREKAKTAEYEKVRKEHPKVERKLGEVLNRHGGRRARYRGPPKILIQELMASFTVNVKRMVKLLCAPTEPQTCGT